MVVRTPALKRLRIAFFSDRPPEHMAPYMRGDWDYLSEIADVRWHSSALGPGWRRLVGPTGWLPNRGVLSAVRDADLVFQWFATPCAPVVAARLLRKASIVIAGGYDVAAVPEIGYGRMLHRRTRLMGLLALRGATRVLAFSKAALAEVMRWAPRSRAGLLYLGLDPERYRLGTAKRRQVVTVGTVSKEYLQRKGLDVFARTSRLLPDVPFVLVGKHVDAATVSLLRDLGGPNLRLTGFLPEGDLRVVLEESAVYAQLSLHEGFGYAVAEAMLCGCHPVVTKVGSLPEVVGELGIYVEAGSHESTAAAIHDGLLRPRDRAARARIEKLFPSQARRQALLDFLYRVTGGFPPGAAS